MTVDDAFALLERLGASPRLLRHHALVVEAAELLCVRLPAELGLSFDADLVRVGAALHDAGKILHPDELRGLGHAHEVAGRDLLLAHGVPPEVARFCVTHAAWEEGAVEDLVVALADKLWKGVRVDALEWRLSRFVDGPEWQRFAHLDAICEAIAADGPERLERSRE